MEKTKITDKIKGYLDTAKSKKGKNKWKRDKSEKMKKNSELWFQKGRKCLRKINFFKHSLMNSEGKKTVVDFVEWICVIEYGLALFFLLFVEIFWGHKFIDDIVCLFQLFLLNELKALI